MTLPQVDLVLKYINDVRENPKSFIPHLENIKSQYVDKYWKRPGKDILKTKEGVQAVDNAIKMLETQKPCIRIKTNPHL
jgi:hypothetical protein